MTTAVEALPEWPLILDLVATVDTPEWVSWLSHLPASARILRAKPKEKGGIVVCAASVLFRPAVHGLSAEDGVGANDRASEMARVNDRASRLARVKRRAAMRTVLEKFAGSSAVVRFTPVQVQVLADVVEGAPPADVGRFSPLRPVVDGLLRLVRRSVDESADPETASAAARIRVAFANESVPVRPPPVLSGPWGPLANTLQAVTGRTERDKLLELSLSSRTPTELGLAALGWSGFRDLRLLKVDLSDVDPDAAADAFSSVGPRPALRTLRWLLPTSPDHLAPMFLGLSTLRVLGVPTAPAVLPATLRILDTGGLADVPRGAPLERVELGVVDPAGEDVPRPEVPLATSLRHLGASEVWQTLTSLKLRGAGPDDMAVLAALPPPSRLERLEVTTGRVDDAGALLLADAARRMPALIRLDTPGNEIGPAGIRALYAVRGAFPGLQGPPRDRTLPTGTEKRELEQRAFLRLVDALAEVAARVGSPRAPEFREIRHRTELREVATTTLEDLEEAVGDEDRTARELVREALGCLVGARPSGWGACLSLVLGTLGSWRTDGPIAPCHDPRPLEALVESAPIPYLQVSEWPSIR